VKSLHLFAGAPKDQGSPDFNLTTQWPCWIELGNLQARRGAREQAIRAYKNARANANAGDEIIGLLTNQIQRISKEDPKSVPALRNPVLE
jgi:hypothetical protein